MPSGNWIKLYRSVLEDYPWEDGKPKCDFAAWIYLLTKANYKDTVKVYRQQTINLCRGQLVTSIVALSDTWKWSRKKVRRFLQVLQEKEMIIYSCDNRGVIISIINYEKYQGENDEKVATEQVSKRQKIR